MRVADNPALLQSVVAGSRPVAGLFVLDPALFDPAREASAPLPAQQVSDQAPTRSSPPP
ncbi:hypothetical protein [Tenggerimyces flavus]|uniref:Photolyase/cryptochrome alpha/beta domain-containing protein n=1 Tax=Tenggerimyces flavus TaxID=1708749 RepID=A0ABV7YEA1_9ACTN